MTAAHLPWFPAEYLRGARVSRRVHRPGRRGPPAAAAPSPPPCRRSPRAPPKAPCGRDQGAQDREGMAHDDILRAPVDGHCDRVIQEGPDRRQADCMCHGSQGTGVALVELGTGSRAGPRRAARS